MKDRARLFKLGVDYVMQGQQGFQNQQQDMLIKLDGAGQNLTNNGKMKIEYQQNDYHSIVMNNRSNSSRSGLLRTISQNKDEGEQQRQIQERLAAQHAADEEESQQDDLKQFDNNPNPNSIPDQLVKKQDEQVEVKVQNADDSRSLSDASDELKEQIMKKSSQKIGAHIIATYNTKNKKHIPKDEKTKIELENVFLRTYDKEMFYTKLNCEFHQADYSNIKI